MHQLPSIYKFVVILISTGARAVQSVKGLDYGLYNPRVKIQFPAHQEIFAFLYIQTWSGAHPTFCTIGTGDCFPEADQSPPVEIRMVELCLHSPRHLHGLVLN
jgi:hypothetical protein